jgi:hypothetical protein
MERIPDDADHDTVEDRRRAADDVEVTVRDGVVGAWTECSDHGDWPRMGTVPMLGAGR